MRPVVKGAIPLDINNTPKVFTDHKQAKRDLIGRIGSYCSYCERKISSNLAIEHVKPKGINPALRLVWDNFLLACTNCNSTKGSANLNLVHYYWPDQHNTFIAFEYRNTGFLSPSKNPIVDSIIAKNTIELTGINVIDISDEASDTRWEERLETWFLAEEELFDFENSTRGNNEIQGIIRTAIGHGFWSIWMKVFENHVDVQDALIAAFTGTFTECRTTNIDRG